MTGFGEFRVGAVIRQTVDVLGAHMPVFLGFAFLFDLTPQILSLALASPLPSAPGGGPGGSPTLLSVAVDLLVFSTGTVGRGAMTAAALAACEGRPWSFRSSVGAGAAALASNLGVLVLDYLGVGFSSLLLVFPGLMLLCRWLVAVPANIAERPGVRAALARSRDLTDGHRWPIFGLLLVFNLLGAIVPVAAFLAQGQIGQAGLSPGALVQALSAAVFGLLGNVGAAALYCELRAAKGEAPSFHLASAFD